MPVIWVEKAVKVSTRTTSSQQSLLIQSEQLLTRLLFLYTDPSPLPVHKSSPMAWGGSCGRCLHNLVLVGLTAYRDGYALRVKSMRG